MTKDKLISLFIRGSVALIALSVLAAGFVSYVIIREVPWDKLESGAPGYIKTRNFNDRVERGGFVKKEELSTYWGWSSSDIGFKEKVKALKEDSVLSLQKDGILFHKEVHLPELRKNSCSLIYCLQRRLKFSEIPALLWRGLIGIEDYRFLDHAGVDPKSLLRALWHDLKVLRLEQGGSTLTQQLVKNLFYSNEKKFSRKIKEMVVSTYLEFKLSKEEILEAYFNEVMWGSLQGIKIKGVAAAAFFYFNKKPGDLTPYEASILISLLKGPYFYSPVNSSERLRDRADLVFKKLKELKLFPETSKKWSDERYANWVKFLKEKNNKSQIRSLYYLSQKEREKQTYSNFVLINASESVLLGLSKQYGDLDLALKTQRYDLSKDEPTLLFEHYTKFERDTEKAFNEERHQVGSTLKPIIFGALVEQGLNFLDEVETAPITLKLNSGDWSPRESHGGLPEKVTYKRALLESLNRPIIRAVDNFGFDKFETILKKKIPGLKSPLREYPAQLLGAVELTFNELSESYAVFLQNACKRGIAYEVLSTLSDPTETTIRFRVGENLGKMRFFGKTGTSNNGYDNWFIGYDGLTLQITWVGHEGKRDHEKVFKLYGSNSSFLVYKNYHKYRGKQFNEMACQL